MVPFIRTENVVVFSSVVGQFHIAQNKAQVLIYFYRPFMKATRRAKYGL